jgi:alpha-L-rhamnosidase
MHRTIGGIAPLSPGYDRVLVAPRPGGGLSWAKATLDTRHGAVATEWAIDDSGGLTLAVTVPEGVEAVVRVPGPGSGEMTVGAGQHQFSATLPKA